MKKRPFLFGMGKVALEADTKMPIPAHSSPCQPIPAHANPCQSMPLFKHSWWQFMIEFDRLQLSFGQKTTSFIIHANRMWSNQAKITRFLKEIWNQLHRWVKGAHTEMHIHPHPSTSNHIQPHPASSTIQFYWKWFLDPSEAFLCILMSPSSPKAGKKFNSAHTSIRPVTQRLGLVPDFHPERNRADVILCV